MEAAIDIKIESVGKTIYGHKQKEGDRETDKQRKKEGEMEEIDIYREL